MPYSSSFVIVDAEWTCEQADELLAHSVANVVVHRKDTDAVYAMPRAKLEQLLGGDDRRRTVKDAMRLDTLAPTPTAHADGAAPVETSVIIDRGRITAIFYAASGFESFTKALRPVAGLARRLFKARLPGTIQVATPVTLKVIIGATGSAVDDEPSIAAAVGATIDLEVETTGALVVDGTAQQAVTIDTDDEIVYRFGVRGTVVGSGQVIVRAYEGPRQIAMVTATVDVIAAAAGTSPEVRRSSRIELSSHLPPDLEIEIIEAREQNHFRVKLTGAESSLGLNRKAFGPIPLDADIDTKLTTFYSAIEGILRQAGSAQDRYDSLAQEGVHLFKQVIRDEALRAALWKVRDRVSTIRIQSEEPWVPWELCRLLGPSDTGAIVTDKFIAERYSVTRWFLGVPEVRTLSMTSIGLVVPAAGGASTGAAERAEVLRLASEDCEVTEISCQRAELVRQLASGTYDVLHFVGHGAFAAADPDRSSFALQNGTRFTPIHLSGEPENLGKAKPIVILNACEVGRSGRSLNGVGGWPWAFVSAGAGAFVGPLWKAAESSAAQFSAELYAALREGKTLGAAINHARQEVRAADDPTWLAYTAYGHPDARVLSTNAPGGEDTIHVP